MVYELKEWNHNFDGGKHDAHVFFPSHSHNGVDVGARPPLASNYRIFQGSDSDEDIEVSDPESIIAIPQDDGVFRGKATHPDSIKEGWVWKQSRHLKRWHRRWLVLTSHTLQTYKN